MFRIGKLYCKTPDDLTYTLKEQFTNQGITWYRVEVTKIGGSEDFTYVNILYTANFDSLQMKELFYTNQELRKMKFEQLNENWG